MEKEFIKKHRNLKSQFESYTKMKKDREEEILKSAGALLFSSGFETPNLILNDIYKFVETELEEFKECVKEEDAAHLNRIIDGVFARVDLTQKIIEILAAANTVNSFNEMIELTEKGILV